MAWIQTKLRDKAVHPNYKEFDCDTDADIKNLPGLEKCAMGSKAFAISSSTEYKLNSIGEWLPVSTGGSGGGGGTSTSVDLDVEGETLVVPDEASGFAVQNETLICL